MLLNKFFSGLKEKASNTSAAKGLKKFDKTDGVLTSSLIGGGVGYVLASNSGGNVVGSIVAGIVLAGATSYYFINIYNQPK